jgi:hypothetical protein
MALFVFMDYSAPPTFGNYPFFPLVFETTGAGRAYRTNHTSNADFDFFDKTRSTALWRINLGGLVILPKFIDEWDAFHDLVSGMQKPFLFRLMSRRFEIERHQPSGIGTGDGHTTEFQLVKTRSFPSGPVNISKEVVNFPFHYYPQMTVPIGNGEGTILYKTEVVNVWVNGVLKRLGEHFDVDRETGVISFTVAPANGSSIQAACKFFILLHGQDYYNLQLSGGVWRFPAGAELFQVASEVATSPLYLEDGGS